MSAPVTHPLPSNTSGGCSVRDLFFSPLRFCGRQWTWIRSDSDYQVSQIALKALAVPFLTCATAISFLPAAVGASVFSADYFLSMTAVNPGGNMDLLKKGVSNETVAKEVKERLSHLGCECSVVVKSRNREVINAHYPNHIHRYVTIEDPSSTKITRFFAVIKEHFYNTDPPSLNLLYPCVYSDNLEENLPHIKRMLALHGAFSVSMAYDLSYVRTELGLGNDIATPTQ